MLNEINFFVVAIIALSFETKRKLWNNKIHGKWVKNDDKVKNHSIKKGFVRKWRHDLCFFYV